MDSKALNRLERLEELAQPEWNALLKIGRALEEWRPCVDGSSYWACLECM